MLNLSNLKVSRKSKRERITVGRGNASGKGTFSGRGIKGQRARTGGSNKLKRLGMRRIIMSTPKLRGFRSLKAKPLIVNIADLEKMFQAGDRVTPKSLMEKGLIDSLSGPVKLLAEGKITKGLTLAGLSYSAAAAEKVKNAGGKLEMSAKKA